MILKKKPIQKVYANNLTQKQLEPSTSASPSAVTELVAEPIPTNVELEDNIANSDDELNSPHLPDSKTESPNPIQTLPQPAVGKPPQPTAAKQATPAIQKQLQRIILFKESKLTKFSK